MLTGWASAWKTFCGSMNRESRPCRIKDACDYLESVMRKGQADWQVKQSLDAIGLLMKHGYERHELGVPQLREAWGNRLNER